MKFFLCSLGLALFLPQWVCAIEPPPIKEVGTEVRLESNRAEDSNFGVHSPVPADGAQTESEIRSSGKAGEGNPNKLGPVLSYPGHEGGVTSVVVAAGGKRILTSGLDGKVLQHLVQDDADAKGKSSLYSEAIYQSEKPVLALALSPNEKYLALAQYSLSLVIDLETREVVRSLSQISGRITALAWDPRSELIVLGLAGGEVYGWQLEADKHYKADTKASLEEYRGGVTSILSIVFHPAGRAFFAAERGGTVSLWRLLRTEKEMGLWDKEALVDQEQRGRKRVVFARLGTRIEDVLLDSRGEYFFAAGANGLVYRWKLRGLKLTDVFVMSDDSPVSLIEMPLNNDSLNSTVLVSAGRDHQLRAWCAEPSKEAPAELTQAEALLTASAAAQGAVIQRPQVLGASMVLQSAVSNLTSGRGAGLLWASQKTGNLLSFDARKLMDLEHLARLNELCGGDVS